MEPIDILGIDLGTTNSAIALWDTEQGRATVLENHEGNPLTPSVVAFDGEARPTLVGAAAVEELVHHPQEVVYSAKRLIGSALNKQQVRQYQENASYTIQETEQHHVVVQIGEHTVTPQQVSAQVLSKLKKDAEAVLGRPVDKAIITVPAYFNESQREATKDAGELAGLSVPRIINEPTAAALAFGLGAEPQTIAVYDMGGGTFDISILQIRPGLFRVKATGGDTHLGGDDIDRAIVEWIQRGFRLKYKRELSLRQNARLQALLRKEAERAKIALSSVMEVPIYIPHVFTEGNQIFDIDTLLTRTMLDELMQPFIMRSLKVCEELLTKKHISVESIDQVLLVGGQTRSPAIRRAIESKFGWKLNYSINPDEAVAQGAAILGARLCGHLKEQVSLLDVLPQSLGIQLANGNMEYILRANETIPVTVWRRGPQAFTTDKDGQERIQFRIFQGEDPIATNNFYIGEVVLTLTTIRPKGEAHINCMFKVDQDGILHVRAEDADTESEPVEATFTRHIDAIHDANPQPARDSG